MGLLRDTDPCLVQGDGHPGRGATAVRARGAGAELQRRKGRDSDATSCEGCLRGRLLSPETPISHP